MATTKELLEAEAFQRRRVVAALLTGSPHHDPARIVRAVAVGVVVVLAVLAGILAAAYLGVQPWTTPAGGHSGQGTP